MVFLKHDCAELAVFDRKRSSMLLMQLASWGSYLPRMPSPQGVFIISIV
jgi:hypothetical protein